VTTAATDAGTVPMPIDEQAAAPVRGRWRAPGGAVPTWWAIGLAVAAGLAMLMSFPMPGVWVAAPVGVALLAVAVHRRGFWGGVRLGAVTGVTLFVPLLAWTHIVGGAAPWLLLAGMEAGYIALLGGAAAFASPYVDRHRWTWPLTTAVLWVAQEAARDRTPFGGFPWGRLAFSQGDSPALRVASLGGAPLVTFVVALAGGLLAAAGWALVADRRRATAGLMALGAVAVVLAGLAVPISRPSGRTVQVAIVQGNVPRLGLGFNEQRRAVLDNHVKATLALAAQVDAGRAPRPDLVIWPENSTDLDPRYYPQVYSTIAGAVNAIHRPVLVGTLLANPVRNAGVLWLPGRGPGQTYVKRQLVPFGEYIPFRGLLKHITSLVNLQPQNFTAGHRAVVFRAGKIRLGDVICYEVGFDGLVSSEVNAGANLLAVQTNDATFEVDGQRGETLQQLAMARIRAVESNRAVVVASTTGVSAIIAPDGRLTAHSGTWQRAVLEARVPLVSQRTLADRIGAWPQAVIVVLTLVALAWATAAALRRRRTAAR
jgi:apolipoprotein N-acyltransferase